jgi:phosphohistidine phosphatase SixA
MGTAGPYPAPSTGTPTRTLTPAPGTPTVRPAVGTAVASSSGGNSSGGGSSGGAPTLRPPPSHTPQPGPPTATRTPTEDRRPITLLRRGGLVIYQRHGHTDWTQNDRELEWVKELLAEGDDELFEDCDRQRLLNDQGRDEARQIGDAIRGLGIPIGEVLTSPWCRTRETAKLAFGDNAEVAEGRLFDTGYLASGSEERNEFREKLRDLLTDGPGEGANRVIVGHMPQLLDAANISLAEGEAAIFQPGDGGFKLLTRVQSGDWARLGN